MTDSPYTYADLMLGSLRARESSRKLDEHWQKCEECKKEPFGLCPEAMKIIAGLPDYQEN